MTAGSTVSLLSTQQPFPILCYVTRPDSDLECVLSPRTRAPVFDLQASKAPAAKPPAEFVHFTSKHFAKCPHRQVVLGVAVH